MGSSCYIPHGCRMRLARLSGKRGISSEVCPRLRRVFSSTETRKLRLFMERKCEAARSRGSVVGREVRRCRSRNCSHKRTGGLTGRCITRPKADRRRLKVTISVGTSASGYSSSTICA